MVKGASHPERHVEDWYASSASSATGTGDWNADLGGGRGGFRVVCRYDAVCCTVCAHARDVEGSRAGRRETRSLVAEARAGTSRAVPQCRSHLSRSGIPEAGGLIRRRAVFQTSERSTKPEASESFPPATGHRPGSWSRGQRGRVRRATPYCMYMAQLTCDVVRSSTSIALRFSCSLEQPPRDGTHLPRMPISRRVRQPSFPHRVSVPCHQRQRRASSD